MSAGAGGPADPVATESPAAESRAVYAYALRAGVITTDNAGVAADLALPRRVVDAAVARLQALHLLRDEGGHHGRRLVPVDPEVASASLILPIDEEVQRRRAAICDIRQQLGAFRPDYEQTRRALPTADIEEPHDVGELAGYLYSAAERCQERFVAFTPTTWLTGRPDPSIPFGPAAWRRLVDRGIAVRLMMQHAVRTDIRACGHLDALLGSGAEVRTTDQLPRRLMIFDTEVAVLLHEDAVPGRVGVIIRHRPTVGLLLHLVESSWTGAHPYRAKQLGYGDVSDRLQRTIVELLADGLTDEGIARRLGLSVRTCRRHIAGILRGLDAVSRFQAGVLATSAGLVERAPSVNPREGRHLSVAG